MDLGATVGSSPFPSVMLSPNAANVIALTRGGGATVTVNVHESLRCCASVTVHVTEVGPIGKLDAGGGVHAFVTGDAPPAVRGGGYGTLTGCPSRDGTDCAAGHVMRGASVGGDGVAMGVAAHPAVVDTARMRDDNARGYLKPRDKLSL